MYLLMFWMKDMTKHFVTLITTLFIKHHLLALSKESWSWRQSLVGLRGRKNFKSCAYHSVEQDKLGTKSLIY